MKRMPYLKYYRVDEGDTAVTLVSCNNFEVPVANLQNNKTGYFLLPKQERYLGYTTLVTALEKAKAGALAYIEHLVSEGEASIPQLLQYRVKHYEDLNINLVEANISRIEEQLQKDQKFKWSPYRIPPKQL